MIVVEMLNIISVWPISAVVPKMSCNLRRQKGCWVVYPSRWSSCHWDETGGYTEKFIDLLSTSRI